MLLVHMRPTGDDADRAAETALAPGDHRAVRVEPVFDAGAALLVLLENTTLSVYEPRGLTCCGQRQLGEGHAGVPGGTVTWRVPGLAIAATLFRA